jgi:hypothetical protein
MDRADICRELDKRAIPTIPALEALGIFKWVDGWLDQKGRRSLSTFFSKKGKGRKPSN